MHYPSALEPKVNFLIYRNWSIVNCQKPACDILTRFHERRLRLTNIIGFGPFFGLTDRGFGEKEFYLI